MTAPATPTPASFVTGWLKQDPTTMQVAIRTDIPDPGGVHDWGVMTVDRGGYFATYDTVQGWTDIPNTPVPGT